MAGVPIQKIKRFKLKGRYSHNKTFGAPLVIPPTLGRIPKYILDQGVSSYCTAAGHTLAGSYFFGRLMSFEYQTAKEGEVNGEPIFNGADPNTADSASTTYGFLPDEQSPLKFTRDGWTRPADWRNYPPTLGGQAIVNLGFAPFNVYPDYDSIKSALVAGLEDDAIVIANGYWYSEFNDAAQNPGLKGIMPVPYRTPITLHEYTFIDYRTINGIEYLVAQLSQGTSFGDGGVLYMSRECVNTAFANPSWNGLGCTIFRKGGPAPIETLISKYHTLIDLLGQLLHALGLKV